MKNLALARIQTMQPYSPPLDGRSTYKGLLLDFNERTIPTSPAVIEALQQFLATPRLQLYPEYFDLPEKIAAYAHTEPDQVMITNGTDQAIDVIFRTFADVGDKVIIPEPSFAMYGQTANVAGQRIINPLYEPDTLLFPLQQILDAIDDEVKLIVVCNPNSPTGTLAMLADIEQIATQASDGIIYVDEAYFEFSGRSAVGLIAKHPNIIVSRTFSKAFGLAGLRLGYIIAHPQYISEMLKVRGPYDVGQLAYYAASAALADIGAVTTYTDEIMKKAKPLVEDFFKANNVTFYPSAGNFILFKPDAATQVADMLRQNGITVRPQNKPNIPNTLRLTIGTVEQMQTFINIYKTVILDTKQSLRKYAFIDRDGTLIFEPQDTFYIDSVANLHILPGVIEALQKLQDEGYTLVIVTNQDDLGTPANSQAVFDTVQAELLRRLDEAGISFDEVLICPHGANDGCACRKPETDLVAHLTDIDHQASIVIGNSEADMGFASKLGVRGIKVTVNQGMKGLNI